MARYMHDDERRDPPWEFIDSYVDIFCADTQEYQEAIVYAYDPPPLNQIDVLILNPNLNSTYGSTQCIMAMVWNNSGQHWTGKLLREDTYMQSFSESVITKFKKTFLNEHDFVGKSFILELSKMPKSFVKYLNLTSSERSKIFPESIPLYEEILKNYTNLFYNALKKLKKSNRPFSENNKFLILYFLTILGFGYSNKLKGPCLLEASSNNSKFGLPDFFDKSCLNLSADYKRLNDFFTNNKVEHKTAITYLADGYGGLEQSKKIRELQNNNNQFLEEVTKNQSQKFFQEILDIYEEKFRWDTKEFFILFDEYFKELISIQ